VINLFNFLTFFYKYSKTPYEKYTEDVDVLEGKEGVSQKATTKKDITPAPVSLQTPHVSQVKCI